MAKCTLVLVIWGVTMGVAIEGKSTSGLENPGSPDNSTATFTGRGDISYLQTFNIGVDQGIQAKVLSAVEKLGRETRASQQKIQAGIDGVQSAVTRFNGTAPDQTLEQIRATVDEIRRVTSALVEVDECSSNPCQHGGSCVDAINRYQCSCQSGHSGINCQTSPNQCHSHPCANGGVCSEGVEGYSCLCLQGFTGQDCQTTVGHRDCGDIKKANRDSTSGVYTILIDGSTPVEAFCDMDTNGGGWLVFQKRFDGSVNFLRDWETYAEGFGSLENGEFWWGNRKLHQLSRQRSYKLRVDLGSFSSGRRFAEYSNFAIASEGNTFRLSLGAYSGDAGDGMTRHANQAFSTVDSDNDITASHCAQTYKGAWWYKDCHDSNLNGLYFPSAYQCTKYDCMQWKKWTTNSLQTAELKMRSDSF